MSEPGTIRPPKPFRSRGSLGPIADLESHLHEEWWRELFDAYYLMTDGDVVENENNTKVEVDRILEVTDVSKQSPILDLCCGQGRHLIELARRGYSALTGVDRSKFLIRLARKRAKAAGLAISFKEGDARRFRLPANSRELVSVMGNSFGYFSSQNDDLHVLNAISHVLKPSGTLLLDLANGDDIRERFDARSWEWIDQHHFVCRERDLSKDGGRLVCREVIVHDERGVIADQFYAERLYTRQSISKLLHEAGFREIRFHREINTDSDRKQDLGLMALRMFLTARAPEKFIHVDTGKGKKRLDIAVLLGDPRLPDKIKRNGAFNDEDFETVHRLKDVLGELNQYSFRFLDNHATMIRDLTAAAPDFILNFCDEGWNNDPFKELHVPALLDIHGLQYSGAGPSCLAMCYDKSLVRALAESLDIPVPLETFVGVGDQSATLPAIFPALIKPNFGDSSFGITKSAVVFTNTAFFDYLEGLRQEIGEGPVLVQEFLSGTEYTVGLLGNPGIGLTALPVIEVDYSLLPKGLPHILGNESKWDPTSPYWTEIQFKKADLTADEQNLLIDQSAKLFERLKCQDYARFDFRRGDDGVIKLLEVNPNPGWCWDGKMNLMAELSGLSYAEFINTIISAALDRIGQKAQEAGQAF